MTMTGISRSTMIKRPRGRLAVPESKSRRPRIDNLWWAVGNEDKRKAEIVAMQKATFKKVDEMK